MKRSRILGLVIGLLILGGFLFVGDYWFRTWADPYWNAEHSRLRIEKTLDPDVLQSWAANLLKQYSHETNFGDYFGVDAPLPSGLDTIWLQCRPGTVLRDGMSGGERYVCLTWGSAMLGRWGLALGSSTFVLQVGMEFGDPPDKPPRLWKRGVYFFQHYQ